MKMLEHFEREYRKTRQNTLQVLRLYCECGRSNGVKLHNQAGSGVKKEDGCAQ